MAQYYYLIAGLPDLLLDERRMRQPPAAVMGEIEQELTAADAALLRLIRMPADHRNLLRAAGLASGPFDPDGSLEEEEAARLARDPRNAPPPFADFMSQQAAGRAPVPGMSARDHLAWLFYEQVLDHPHAFVRGWFTFDRDLRNVLAALAVRESAVAAPVVRETLERVLVGRDEITAAIMRNPAQDFGLASSHPWITRLAAIDGGDLLWREKAADTLRWDVLDDLSVLSHFGIEAVLAFVVRFFMVRRWQALDAVEGARRLERLLDSLGAAIEGEPLAQAALSANSKA